MKKYWLARTSDNVITYGQTEWDGIVTNPQTTYESFEDEIAWKKQIAHYQSIYPQNIDMDLPINGEDLFPFPDLNIRVFISHYGITRMQKSPYENLIKLALLAVNEVSESGVTIYLSRLENDTMDAEEVQDVLESFGAQILFKD
jgi:hypothetical protein